MPPALRRDNRPAAQTSRCQPLEFVDRFGFQCRVVAEMPAAVKNDHPKLGFPVVDMIDRRSIAVALKPQHASKYIADHRRTNVAYVPRLWPRSGRSNRSQTPLIFRPLERMLRDPPTALARGSRAQMRAA